MTHRAPGSKVRRSLALEMVRVTEAAALATSELTGRGDERAADLAAVGAMHEALACLNIRGTVVVGEGDEGVTPHLYVGEPVGDGTGPQVDVAVMALEGTTICAKGAPNALAVIAFAENGGFLKSPNVYMDKIAVGPSLPEDVIDLDASPGQNLKELAKAKGVQVGDLVACILDRPRHEEKIALVREAGARIMLITDGDVSGVIACADPKSGVDIYMGIGGGPQGVLAAAALHCIGGQMQGRLLFRNRQDQELGRRHGIEDFARKYALSDLAGGEVMFAATGVTTGSMLRGVRRIKGWAETHSLFFRSSTGTVRHIESRHRLDRAATVR